MGTRERITSAAIRWCYKNEGEQDLKILPGRSHAECIATFAVQDILRSDRNMDLEESGFITSEDRFVDRREAYDIAEKAGQLIATRGSRVLYSEFVEY